MSLSGNIVAKERRGVELEIFKNDNKQLKGELIAVKKDSILLLESSSASDISVSISDVDRIKILGKSKTLWRAAQGFLVVGGTGATIGAISSSSDFSRLTPARGALVGGVIGGLAGLLLGTIFGLEEGADKTIQIAGKNDDEIRPALRDLRSKARIRDYQ
jgi:hypothetical protein